ncbi:hypothetical protein [Wenjunlia tyrosinilytica]|uniref:Uncharacterized protein n=1 Tax=Wenjunlia tyrosinilytica TaxID=1544741 RepID=A0A917ZYA4_9ACTN|nr:hypothetical protein [Wenjunlia tyrosinilytica]GGP00228.1 hypothetical protein GCM10012280_68530 [Wenjunlia tyrosinilytica]
MSDQYSNGIACTEAVLSRRYDRLEINWAHRGLLDLPVAWCQKADVSDIEGGPDVQIVLRFAPQAAEGQPPQGQIAVRLHASGGNALAAREFAETLRRELSLREQDDEVCAPPPELAHVPQQHADWVNFGPGRDTQELFEAVRRRLVPESSQ